MSSVLISRQGLGKLKMWIFLSWTTMRRVCSTKRLMIGPPFTVIWTLLVPERLSNTSRMRSCLLSSHTKTTFDGNLAAVPAPTKTIKLDLWRIVHNWSDHYAKKSWTHSNTTNEISVQRTHENRRIAVEDSHPVVTAECETVLLRIERHRHYFRVWIHFLNRRTS